MRERGSKESLNCTKIKREMTYSIGQISFRIGISVFLSTNMNCVFTIHIRFHIYIHRYITISAYWHIGTLAYWHIGILAHIGGIVRLSVNCVHFSLSSSLALPLNQCHWHHRNQK